MALLRYFTRVMTSPPDHGLSPNESKRPVNTCKKCYSLDEYMYNIDMGYNAVINTEKVFFQIWYRTQFPHTTLSNKQRLPSIAALATHCYVLFGHRSVPFGCCSGHLAEHSPAVRAIEWMCGK
jgi:hypothetical protein